MFSLHTEALAYLRYARRLPVVCTEAGGWNADVVGMNSRLSVELEIKKSISDLRAEFRAKSHKHYMYAHADEFSPRSMGGYIPNVFYFFVPQELGEKAVEVAREHAPKAGVAALLYPAKSPFTAGRGISVLKKAEKLHDRPPSTMFLHAALMRMGSEICGFRLAIERLKKEPLDQKLIQELCLAVRRQAGALDFEGPDEDLEGRARELATVVEHADWAQLNLDQRQRWIGYAQQLIELSYQGLEERREEVG